MKALHIGAGKIGRGFIGAKLSESGYQLTFADINRDIVAALNRDKQYTLHIMEQGGGSKIISKFDAVEIASEAFFERFNQADIVTTAVSMAALPRLATTIAKALCFRHINNCNSALNIICCENGIRATSELKRQIFDHLDTQTKAWCQGSIGFVDCAVDRIVPIATFDNPLDVGAEQYCEWNIDKNQIVGNKPSISGAIFTTNLEAAVERKLYTLNTAHCATAYLGAQKGYKYIHEAICDRDIRQIVESIVAESSAALVAKFGFDIYTQQQYGASVLRRFENPLLGDTVARVASEPIRKLSPKLYFAYPVAMSLKYSLATNALATVVAAALAYRSEADVQSLELSKLIAQIGVAKTAEQLTSITDKGFIECVEKKYREF